MRKYFLIITASLLFNTIYSQQYYPLVEENKEWYVIGSFYIGNGPTFIYKCEGDTLMGGNTYKTVFMSMEEFPVNWTKMGFIREDEDHKIFFSQYLSNDTNYFNPRLLYDFNAVIGDSLILSPINEFTDSLEIVITQIDSVLVDGDYHKRTWFDCEYYAENFWIEGIGSNSGLLDVGFYCTVVCPGLDLGCVKKDGFTIYPNGYTGNCYVLGIDEFETKRQYFSISPNPSTDYFVVIPNTHLISQTTFKLYSSQGKVIFQINLDENNPTNINTTHLESGLYLYNIYNENIVIQKGKIIIK